MHSPSAEQMSILAPTNTVVVRVLRLLPFGLSVELPDGRRAIIREREIAWTAQERRQWRHKITVGATLCALPLNSRHEQLELSLRLAQTDPWQAVPQHYQAGMLVAGVVTSVTNYGVFIELEPGVTGLLHASALPHWVRTPLEQLFWVGDEVKVHIAAIRPHQREISLDLQTISKSRWSQGTEVPSPPTRIAEPMVKQHNPAPLSSRGAAPARHFAFLLIEDEPEQNRAIADWLRNLGHRVYTALSAEEGLHLLETSMPEIVLSDVLLPGQNGIETVRTVVQRLPAVHCILMTDWATADERKEELSQLHQLGVRCLLKPFSPEELLQTVQQATEATEAGPLVTADLRQQADEISGDMPQVNSIKREINELLRRLRRQTHATKAILFAFDPYQRQMQVVIQSGRGLLQAKAINDLLHSPVREVAEAEETIRIDDVNIAVAYARYLRPLLDFRSCIGVPVPGRLPQKHALFLFHTAPDFGNSKVEQATLATAERLGAYLEQQTFWEGAAEMQRTLLLGRLTRGLVHEINHQLNPILFTLKELEDQCVTVEEALDLPRSVQSDALQGAKQSLTRLNQTIQKVIQTTRLFSRITVQDQEEVVRIDQIVENCLDIVRDLAHRAKICVTFHPPQQIILTRVRHSQVQQIILNLLLNAIQQIERLRPAEGGAVHVWVSIRNHPQHGNQIYIAVEDDGPGIHRRLWQQIFELGFTTRDGEGSGMGLYLAQHLAQQASGRVYVESSPLLWGARMVVELPVRFEQ